MANYYASARSNYFKVKSIEDLRDSLHPEIEISIKSEDENLVCLLAHTEEGWPTSVYDEFIDEDIDWDVEDAVAPHLQDGEWCVIQEAGAESLRYINGYSCAFDNNGNRFFLNLDDIYKHLPEETSRCEY